MSNRPVRKSLSAPRLLREVRNNFVGIEDDTARRGLTLTDCLMSGLAIFGLKYPSLLQFDRGRADAVVCANLKSLYGIGRAPSDTALRERLDEVDPTALRGVFRRVFHLLQRCKGLAGGPVTICCRWTGRAISCPIRCTVRSAVRNSIETDVRREHPHLKLVVVEDALGCCRTGRHCIRPLPTAPRPAC